MKCGTSTVHTLLGKHPDVYIPKSEVNFFDIDDLHQHPDFYFFDRERWQWPNITDGPQGYWDWYQEFFKDAPKDSLLGEDSTCYLPSPRAAQRISLQSKPIKTIICLRQPTRRSYSQYWHMLRTGRALFGFEDTIKFTPHYVLERSMYLSQIVEFMKYIPTERIFFFVLEEFLTNKERTIKSLSEFLGLDRQKFPDNALDTHANKATFPKNIELQALRNRLLRSLGNSHYVAKLPFPVGSASSSPVSALLDKIHNRINPLQLKATPKMNPATEEFLDRYFRRELQGLGDLIGVDVDSLWFRDTPSE